MPDSGYVVGMPQKVKVRRRQVTVQMLHPKSGEELMPALTAHEAISLGIGLIARGQALLMGDELGE